jgi:hypothetical protein
VSQINLLGKLSGALLRAGFVDEININFFPAIIRGFKTSSLFMSPELGENEIPTCLNLIFSEVKNGRVWL